MMNEFLSSVKDGLLVQLKGKAKIDSTQLNRASEVVTDSFKDGLFDKFKKGQMSDIFELLGQEGNTSPFASSLVNITVSNLIAKLGLSPDLSASVANIAVPFIIEKFSGFASAKGVNNQAGIQQLIGSLASDSLKDNLLGGLSSKFGF